MTQRPPSLCSIQKAAFVALPLFSFVARAQEESLDTRSAFVPYVEYANTSSHILLGIAQNRRVAAAGLDYDRRLLRTRFVSWHYIFDLRPLVLLQDPVSTTQETVQFGSQPPFGPFLVQDGPIQRACHSAVSIDRNQPGVIVTSARTCGTRWTYAGGFSPIGQQLRFRPSHRLQPFALGNAGFLIATRDVPGDHSSRANFTFEFGAGLRLLQSSTKGFSIDYRLRHLSNAGTGDTNPGTDNQILRFVVSSRAIAQHPFIQPRRLP